MAETPTYTRDQVLNIIEDTAKTYDIPKDDFMRFAYIETGGRFDPEVSRGPHGAKGLFQFVPSTAAAYGISGRELDPKVNADAAARLYDDNRQSVVNSSVKDQLPYLSGQAQPNGMDMYLAHQQGAAGYHSVQEAIATGNFSRTDTRDNILNNVSPSDIEKLTGKKYDDFSKMSDRDMATTFTHYWEAKYDRIAIPEKDIKPLAESPHASVIPTANSKEHLLKEGAHGQEVHDLQANLAALGYSVKPDGDFGIITRHAVERFQHTHNLTVDGVVGPTTQNAIQDSLKLQKQLDQGPVLDDPRNPASANHALFNNMKELFPGTSDDRLLQFTAACHARGINDQNLDKVFYNEDKGVVLFSSRGLLSETTVIDVKQAPPQAEQSVQQIQQHGQQQVLNQAQSQAQQAQANQQQAPTQ
jgi:hypothetical protein